VDRQFGSVPYGERDPGVGAARLNHPRADHYRHCIDG
jgi:hypothetical protein